MTLAPGDIVFTRGTGLHSKAIRIFTRHFGEKRTKVNHVGIIAEGGPLEEAIVVEALSFVRRHSLWARYAPKRSTQVAIFRPLGLTEAQIQQIVTKAESYVGREYGWLMIVAHFLDWLLQGAYLFRRIIGSDDYPICSWVVAHAYGAAGLHFGVEAGAADPDDIWDFVEEHPEKYSEVRGLAPLAAGVSG